MRHPALRFYDRYAQYYDSICSFKNYKKESNKLDEFIRKYKKSSGKDLLDVACGTGNHITFLKKRYHVQGLDISPQVLGSLQDSGRSDGGTRTLLTNESSNSPGSTSTDKEEDYGS